MRPAAEIPQHWTTICLYGGYVRLTRAGTIPYLIVYFAGGIYGFVLGGNFGRVGVPSAGASGALFAVVSRARCALLIVLEC